MSEDFLNLMLMSWIVFSLFYSVSLNLWDTLLNFVFYLELGTHHSELSAPPPMLRGKSATADPSAVAANMPMYENSPLSPFSFRRFRRHFRPQLTTGLGDQDHAAAAAAATKS